MQGDTTLRGARLEAPNVQGRIGGDLTIASLQDTSDYESSRFQAGGSVTIGPAPGGSLSLSGQKVDATYASVTEQSGIVAGDGGFQVDVDGRTRLIGGAIASSDAAVAAERNVLTTAGIVTEDLHNRADYQGRGFGLTAGFGDTDGDPEYRGSRMGVGSDSGSAESITRAGVSGLAGHTGIRSGDNANALAPIVDVQQLESELDARVAITGEFGQQASQAWGDYANRQWLDAMERGDDDATACWAADGGCRSAGHLLIGGASGGIDGALGAGLSTQVAPRVLDALQGSDLPQPAQDTLAMLIATTAGGAVGGLDGAAAGYNEAANNAAYTLALCRATPICVSALGGMLGGSAATAVLDGDIAITGDPATDMLALIALERAAEAALFVSDVAGGERTEYPAETDTLPTSTESPLQPIERPGRYETPAYAQEGWASELPIAGPVQGDHTSGGYQPVGTELIGGAVYSERNENSIPIRQYSDGTFSVSDWAGYPADVPRPPVGTTYRLLSGAEYAEARRLANNANANLRRDGVVPEGYEIHEIVPVKYGGSPTDISNKVFLPRSVHRSEVTPWWNRLQRSLK